MDAKDLYRQGVGHALGGFQLLEEGLKTYIGMHFDCVRHFVSDRLRFTFSRADYQDAALGRLLGVFSKLCANQELIADIRAVVRKRDHLAHRALLKLYGSELGTEAEYMPHLAEINDLVQSLPELLQRVGNELEKLRESLRSA